jgi:NitT/TauT family transport system substrate-binding protein
MTNYLQSWLLGAVAVAVSTMPLSAAANERVRAIDSTKGPYDHFSLHAAKDQGYFEKEGLDVPVIFGDGGAATLQALITGSQDVAVGVGVLSVIGAYSKGAPIKIIGNTFKGVGNVIWYVRADSPIKSFKDLNGKELVYSRPGATSHLAVQNIAKTVGITPKLVSVGGMAAARTQVMSGQVDTGWLAAPFNYELIRSGQARIIGTGKEATELKDLTVRVVAANSNWLAKNRETAKKFMRALNQGREFIYTPAGIRAYAKQWKLDPEDAKRGPEFAPKEVTEINKIFGFEPLIRQASELKYLSKPLPLEKARGMLDLIGAEK